MRIYWQGFLVHKSERFWKGLTVRIFDNEVQDPSAVYRCELWEAGKQLSACQLGAGRAMPNWRFCIESARAVIHEGYPVYFFRAKGLSSDQLRAELEQLERHLRLNRKLDEVTPAVQTILRKIAEKKVRLPEQTHLHLVDKPAA